MHNLKFDVFNGVLRFASEGEPFYPSIVTFATAAEWQRRLVDAGLIIDRDGRLSTQNSCLGYSSLDRDIFALAGYYTDRGNCTSDADDWREVIDDNNLHHLPYAALAWIDHEIRETAADHVRCTVNWAGEIEPADISYQAGKIIVAGRRRFAHANGACARAAAANCSPGEVRFYAYGDHEETPIPLCRGCFLRQLARDCVTGRHAKFRLRDGALVLDQWEQADKAPAAASAAATPSVTAATSAKLVDDYSPAEPKAHYESP